MLYGRSGPPGKTKMEGVAEWPRWGRSRFVPEKIPDLQGVRLQEVVLGKRMTSALQLRVRSPRAMSNSHEVGVYRQDDERAGPGQA